MSTPLHKHSVSDGIPITRGQEEGIGVLQEVGSLEAAHDQLDQLAKLAFSQGEVSSERFVRMHDDLRLLASWMKKFRDSPPTPATLLIDANCRKLAQQALNALMKLNRNSDAAGRLKRIESSLVGLKSLRDQSEKVISDRKATKNDQQSRYLKSLEYVVASDRELGMLAAPLRKRLSAGPFEKSLDEIAHSINQRARTAHVIDGLMGLVDRLDGHLRHIADTLPGIKERVEDLHRESPTDPIPVPPALRPLPIPTYLSSLELVRQEISAERRGSLVSLTGRRTSLQRLFMVTASEIRDLLFRVGQDLDAWFWAALQPLEADLQDKRNRLEHQTRQLQRIHNARSRVSNEIQTLRELLSATTQEIRSRNEIDRIIERMTRVYTKTGSQRLLCRNENEWQQQPLPLDD